MFFTQPPTLYPSHITMGDGSVITSTHAGPVDTYGHCLYIPELSHSVCSVSQDAFLGYFTAYTPTEVFVTDTTSGDPIRTGFIHEDRYWFCVPPRPTIPRSISPTSINDPSGLGPSIRPYDPRDPPTLAGATFFSPEPSTINPDSLTFFTAAPAHSAPSREEFLHRITGHSPRPTLNRMIARSLFYPGLPMHPFTSHITTNCTACLQGKMRAASLHRATPRPALPH